MTINLVDWIGKKTIKCPLPNHDDSTPSMQVYDDHVYCFGCKRALDVVAYLVEVEKKPMREALILAGKTNQVVVQRNDLHAKTLKDIATYSANSIKQSLLPKYLDEMKFTDKDVENFQIGYDAMHGFAVFPVLDHNDFVQSIAKRRIQSEGEERIIGAKWIFSKVDVSAPKKEMIYIPECVFKLAKITGVLYVVEGITDVIKLYSINIASVAVLGSSIWEEQVHKILEISNKIVLCFDNDEAGIKCTAKALNMFMRLPVGNYIKTFTFHDNNIDPAESILRYNRLKGTTWDGEIEFFLELCKDVDLASVMSVNNAEDAFDKFMENSAHSAPSRERFRTKFRQVLHKELRRKNKTNFANDLELYRAGKFDTTVKFRTGLKSVDGIVSVTGEGCLGIIGAGTGVGKTNLTLNMMALNIDEKICYFSLEMDRQKLSKRFDKMLEFYKIHAQPLNQEIITESWSLHTIISNIKDEIRDNGTRIFFVDHLHIVKCEGDAIQKIANITGGFANLSREEGVVIILLSQLNREGQATSSKDYHRPELSHLRQGGSIEQDADFVLLVSREEPYYKRKAEEDKKYLAKYEDCKGKAIIDIAKNRHGTSERIEVGFDEEHLTFFDL